MENLIIDNRFLILKSLGSGSAGEVFEASVTSDTNYASVGDHVAIKFYKPWVMSKANQGVRIERELRSGTKVSCSNVIKTYEVGSYEGQVYLVMEYIKGETLRQWMSNKVSIDFVTIISLTTGLIRGIHALHSKGLIHRDIKPENIIITSSGPVILDLGVLSDITGDTVITGEEFLGTIKYAAPEYLFGLKYKSDIDIYSLGLIIYEMVQDKEDIRNEKYWSIQIAEKYNGRLTYIIGLLNNIELFDIKEKLFLLSILEGTIIEERIPFFTEINENKSLIKRFSSEQLMRVFEDRVWESNFNYPVATLIDDDFVFPGDEGKRGLLSEWPIVPNDLEDEVNKFVSEKLQIMSAESAKIICTHAKIYNGLFPSNGRRFYHLEEKTEHLNWLENAGLIEIRGEDYGDRYNVSLNNVAWQLLIRGYFDNFLYSK